MGTRPSGLDRSEQDERLHTPFFSKTLKSTDTLGSLGGYLRRKTGGERTRTVVDGEAERRSLRIQRIGIGSSDPPVLVSEDDDTERGQTSRVVKECGTLPPATTVSAGWTLPRLRVCPLRGSYRVGPSPLGPDRRTRNLLSFLHDHCLRWTPKAVLVD